MMRHRIPGSVNYHKIIIFIGTVLGICWVTVIGGFLWWETNALHKSSIDLAAVEARASFNKDLVYRRWAAGHGGTYVPVTAGTPPNPYLSHIPERDITTPGGKALTLINPAYMTRQVHELAKSQYGVKGHITSLKPMRPENEPDKWERNVLLAFKEGASEVQSIESINGVEYLRLMQPMITEKSCLKCHGSRGYKEGDLRGGISVSVPLSPYRAIEKKAVALKILVYTAILLTGLIGLGFAFFHLQRSERRRAATERSLLESEETALALLNASTESAFLLKTDGTFITLNDLTAQRLGVNKEELVGKYSYDFLPPQIADSRRKQMEKIVATGKPVRFSDERAGIIFDQNIHPLFDAEGNVNRVAVFARDITRERQSEKALKESESKFRKMFEHAPLSYQSLDEQGRFIDVNSTWLDILGYERHDVIGKNFGDFLHPDWSDHFKQNFPRFKAIGEVLGVEFEMVKRDGATILVSFHGKIGRQPDGSFKQTHCIFHDITEQRSIEKESAVLEQKMAEIQKMESIGNLAGGIAHDFNNILFPIVGMSELLMDDFPPGSSEHEHAHEIFRAGMRGSDLVKQILAFSRQDEHKLIPVRIQQVLNEVLTLSRSTIPANIEIRNRISRGCGLVLADPSQVHQVAMNLVTNAFHAVEKRGGTIDIGLKEVTLEHGDLADSPLEAGRYIRFSVSDNGEGIARSLLNKIFEPYFTTKEHGKGTGLGLSVVYGIIKEHKGDIQVYSEVGRGATFCVYLPLMIKPADEQLPVARSEELPTGTESILLVDDEKPVARLEKQILERLGYRVAACQSSAQALGLFDAGPESYDLVITDMAMPNMTGEQLARELMAIRADIPVIICTGFSERINHSHVEEIGIKGFLTKPVIRSDMAKMVRKVLDAASGK